MELDVLSELRHRWGRYYRATPESLWRTHRPARELVASARLVRERIRRDRGIPDWARTILPLIALLQLGTVYLGRPLYLAVGRLARRSGI